jgi:hypothetical protein
MKRRVDGAVALEETDGRLETSTPAGTPVELRAVPEDGAVSIEVRWPRHSDSDWRGLSISGLLDLLKPGTGVGPWLESQGVLWGAWVGRKPREIARFTAAESPPPLPRSRPRRR